MPLTLYDVLTNEFGGRYKLYRGDIGLEIETEAKSEYTVPKFSFWDVHDDGSLRGFGKEYVLKVPLNFKTFLESLKEFKEKTEGIKFVKDSVTTSVHAHLNFLNDGFIPLGNFLTAYSLVENMLIRFSGEDRLSNLFCLPMCDAEEIHKSIMRMLRGISENNFRFLEMNPDNMKYGALNISSLHTYGSLEIRSMRGTTDIELIENWVGMLWSLLSYCRTEGVTPPSIIKSYQDSGADFLSTVFGPYRKFIRYDDEATLVEKNFWFAANTAYAVKDWALLGEPKKTGPYKSKDLNKISKGLFGRSFEELTHGQQVMVLDRAGRGKDMIRDDEGAPAEAEPQPGQMARDYFRPLTMTAGMIHRTTVPAEPVPLHYDEIIEVPRGGTLRTTAEELIYGTTQVQEQPEVDHWDDFRHDDGEPREEED